MEYKWNVADNYFKTSNDVLYKIHQNCILNYKEYYEHCDFKHVVTDYAANYVK